LHTGPVNGVHSRERGRRLEWEADADQYVAAALSLFAAVALLYFYILRILTRR
jgi:FtsH-binding integral membrane protein